MKTFVDSVSQNCDPMLVFDCAGLCRGIFWNLFVRFLCFELIFTLGGLFLGPPGSAVRGGGGAPCCGGQIYKGSFVRHFAAFLFYSRTTNVEFQKKNYNVLQLFSKNTQKFMFWGRNCAENLGPELVFTLCNMFSSLFLGHFVSHSSEAAVRRFF